MTRANPNGRYFVSYRRREPRITEVDVMKSMFDIRGVPTWLDRANLRPRPTTTEIEEMIRNPDTAGAILYMTPEVAADEQGNPSAMIRAVEIPRVIRRAENDPVFSTILVIGGGLTYADANTVYGDGVALANFPDLNSLLLQRTFTKDDAVRVANCVLAERLQAIESCYGPDELLALTLNTRVPTAFSPNVALPLDWAAHFSGRHCSEREWIDELTPALCDVRTAIQRYASHRTVVASGSLALPAALLLGIAFPSTSNIVLGWRQQFEEPAWFLKGTLGKTPFLATDVRSHSPNGRDILLMVSVSQNVRPDVNVLLARLPNIRAIVTIDWEDQNPINADDARAIATAVRSCLVRARGEYSADGTVHICQAVPAGLAVLIGQNLNTFLPVQTYEHDRDQVPAYQKAYALREVDLTKR